MEQQPLFDLGEYTVDKPNTQEMNILSAYLGAEAATQIISKIGGWSVRIPVETKGKEYERLADQIGSELTAKLMQFFGGELLYVPLDYYVQTSQKHDEIRQRVRELLSKGQRKTPTLQQVASEFNVSERHVRRIIG